MHCLLKTTNISQTVAYGQSRKKTLCIHSMSVLQTYSLCTRTCDTVVVKRQTSTLHKSNYSRQVCTQHAWIFLLYCRMMVLPEKYSKRASRRRGRRENNHLACCSAGNDAKVIICHLRREEEEEEEKVELNNTPPPPPPPWQVLGVILKRKIVVHVVLSTPLSRDGGDQISLAENRYCVS